MKICNGLVAIEKEGHTPKFVEQVNQVSFSGKRACLQGQKVRYVTERCVIDLTQGGLRLVEIAPGLDVQKDVLNQSRAKILVASDLTIMAAELFMPELMGL